MQAIRARILQHVRVPVIQTWRSNCISGPVLRPFSAEGKSSFLDKQEVTDRVINVLKKFQKVEPSKISPSAHFQQDLGLDSLDTVELVMAFEEEFSFEIPDSEADKIDSCAAAIDYIASNPKAK
ncbi:hypothetical protein KP509_37G027200 [Ceratopteris richardii]|uniref:Acyl carrier protein n=1 Tax=Ceratopteris richardii TaxID=49495 RepID=A0A8T2Q8N3_CERRI|nr:hypothetical protein KP509_37G027200 [Ceratopteris richardii]